MLRNALDVWMDGRLDGWMDGWMDGEACEHNSVKSMNTCTFKLYMQVICLNILNEFDQQHPVTFGSRSTRGQRSNLVTTITSKV